MNIHLDCWLELGGDPLCANIGEVNGGEPLAFFYVTHSILEIAPALT